MRNAVMTTLRLLTVGIVYIAMGTLFYRQRIFGAGAIWDFDFWVFGIPALVAFIANSFVIGVSIPSGWRPGVWVLAVLVGAVLTTFVAAVVGATVMFNMYGT